MTGRVDRLEALSTAEERLSGMMDVEYEEEGEVPSWLHAAHAAVLSEIRRIEYKQAHG